MSDRPIVPPGQKTIPSWKKSAQKALKREIGQTPRSSNGSGKVILAIDVSGSMDGDPLAQAKEGARKFAIDARKKGYATGLVSFGSTARLHAEPSVRDIDLESAISNLVISGSTAMHLGLERAFSCLSSDKSTTRAITVVTDGYPDDASAALAVARRIKEAGIDILTLGTDDADHAFLRMLASREDLAVQTTTRSLAKSIEQMSDRLSLPKPK